MTTVTVHPSPEAAAAAQGHPQQPHAQHPAQTFAQAYQPPGGGQPGNYPQAQPVIPTAPQYADTPSQTVVNRAAKVVRVTDEFGRVIGIRKLSAGDRMRLMRVLGGELTENSVYFGHAALAFCVREFEGETQPQLGTSTQIEAMVERLGDEGLNAIARGMVDHFGMGNQQAAPEEVIAAAKN